MISMASSTSNRNCSVFGCSNTYSKSFKEGKLVQFYSFPSRPWLVERRELWIKFARRQSLTGKPWKPTKLSRICSEHFVDGVKSENPKSPSYNPTIHPIPQYNVVHLQTDRAARLGARESRNCQPQPLAPPEVLESEVPILENNQDMPSTTEIPVQTDTVPELHYELTAFTCTHVNKNTVSTQVSHTTFHQQQIEFRETGSGPNQRSAYFGGYNSAIHTDTVTELCGVSNNVFSLLISLLSKQSVNIKELRLEDKLLLTLMRIKVGVTFQALSAVFGIHRTTASKIFYTLIHYLYYATKDWIIFPSKAAIQETMPESFKANYSNCRVIIDCTEIKTETPPTVEQRVHMYSNYKSGYTVKFLIGICPNGFISYISKGYGGRATDSFITNDCGIIDLLEDGDIVLADKGFPRVQVKNDVVLVMPPFSKRNESQFSSDHMQETYLIASVRIHVERAIQRVKIFNIFNNRIPITMLLHLDKIMHLCVILVNLGPPLFKV